MNNLELSVLSLQCDDQIKIGMSNCYHKFVDSVSISVTYDR